MALIIKNQSLFLLLFLNNSRTFNVGLLVNCKLYLCLKTLTSAASYLKLTVKLMFNLLTLQWL